MAIFLPVFTSYVHAAPRVSTALEQDRVSVNREFDLFISISWHGEPDDYIIVPPEPVLPEGIVQVSSSFFSSVSSDAQIIKYHYVLKAQKKGRFTLYPVEIKYWGKGSEHESVLISDEVSFEAALFAFLAPGLIWGVGLAVAAVFITIIVVAVVTNRRVSKKKTDADWKGGRGREYIIEKLHECRQCRIKGDHKGFYRAAFETAQIIFDKDKAFLDTLFSTLEKVQFGGYMPSSEEINRVFRQIEKKAGEITSDKKDKELEYKKYINQ